MDLPFGDSELGYSMNVVKTMSKTTHLGMVYTTCKNGDDWGIVYRVYHIRAGMIQHSGVGHGGFGSH